LGRVHAKLVAVDLHAIVTVIDIFSFCCRHPLFGGIMFDVERLLGQMLGGSALGKVAGSVGSGLGSVNGGIGSGLSKGALGIGALGVAWAAFEHFQEQNKQAQNAGPGVPPPMPSMPPPPPMAMPAPEAAVNALPAAENDREADAAHLIRAMIAAANADGKIDAEERSRVLERALSAGLSPATQQFLLAQLNAPAALSEIVTQTRDHLKRETYGASLMAITNDTDAEKQYLAALAAGLGLSAQDADRIEAALR
jgi:uncharacterized membrane protein YebE (DUF533 family)